MSITEKFNKSLDSKNLEEFSELVSISSQYINDIFSNGLLHHMLSKYPDLSLDFYKVVIDVPSTDINNNDSTILPPILRTKRDDIISLLLSNRSLNVNLLFGNTSLAKNSIDDNNLSLLQKLAKTGRLDIAELELMNYAMSKNMDAFRILLELLEPHMCNELKPVVYAIHSNNAEALDLLLENGCTIDIKSVKELVGTNSHSMIAVLIKYLKKIMDKKGVMSLAINNNNVELFRAISKFTRDIQHDDIYNNLDKPEIIGEIFQLINDVGEREVANTLFMAIIKSRNPTHYKLLDRLTINSVILSDMLGLLLTFSKIKELVEVLQHTDVFIKTINGSLAVDIIDQLINTGGEGVIKKLLEDHNLGLDGKVIYLYSFINGGHYDILLKLLTDYKITIRYDKIIDDAILAERYELVQVLIEKYGFLPNRNELFERLLDKPEIVRSIVRIDPESLLEEINAEGFVKIMTSIANDSGLLQQFIQSLESLERYKLQTLLTRRSSLDVMLTKPQYILRLIENPMLTDILFEPVVNRLPMGPWDEEDEDDNKYVIFELLKVLDKPQRDLVLDAIRHNNLVDDLIYLHPLDKVIEINDSELFGYLLERLKDSIEEMDIPNLFNYLAYNPRIALEHIDNLLQISSIIVTDAIPIIMSLLEDEELNELFRSSNVIDKVLEHPNMRVNSLIDEEVDPDEPGEQHQISVLDSVVGNIDRDDYNDKNWRNMERLRVLKKLLLHPELDVNVMNTHGHTLAQYIISNIFTLANVDYESDENFDYPHAVLRLILAHPRFDINANRKIFPFIFDDSVGDYTYLLTVFISRPEFDVNYCRLLHSACHSKRLEYLRIVLGIPNTDVNLVAIDEKEGTRVTPMHLAIERNFVDGIKLLLEDPRFDMTVLDSKGRNYARLAAKTGLREIVALFAARGVVDDKQERIDREIAEYEAKMAAQGRVKQARIRETLNSFDLILKERETTLEDLDEGFSGSITAYSRTVCPFCLTYLEKEQPYECLYLSGHRCPEELQNEPLKRLYFGSNWETKIFEICCTCGRPCEHHGHFTPVESGGPSELARNDSEANHWACNSHNGGGGKLEMVTRLIGMLSELKRRVDTDERLVYGPELIKELAMIANNSLFNGAIRDRAIGVLERKKWNVNSKIPKYAKFNAPTEIRRNNNNSNRRMRNAREPIVHYDNPAQELQCMICLDEAEHLFKPHSSDEGYICDECLKRQVCASRYASVTCELGCKPKKQIYKEDVNALMDGNFCEDVAMAAPEEWAEE